MLTSAFVSAPLIPRSGGLVRTSPAPLAAVAQRPLGAGAAAARAAAAVVVRSAGRSALRQKFSDVAPDASQ